jgi:hypothetical protein
VGSEPEADLGAETAGGGRTNQDDAWGPRWMLLLVVLVRARAGRLCGVKAQGVGQGMPAGGDAGYWGLGVTPARSAVTAVRSDLLAVAFRASHG